jgi:hypothetical protein
VIRHAGGIIRAVLQLTRSLARPRPQVSPAPEWEPTEFGRGRAWTRSKYRAYLRRVARWRARKGYRFAAEDKL